MTALSVNIRKKLDKFSLDVSWEMGHQLLVLFGPSGSGKTITLQMIAGLMTPDEGMISSGEKTFFDSGSRVHLSPQKRSLGYVFQDRALFPHMTVRQNIGYGVVGINGTRQQEMVASMIRTFHLEDVEHKYPSEISGGQKQRVTLARALIGRPQVLLLDEPFSALDNNLRIEMRQLLKGIRRDFDVPIVLVTHDLLEAYTIADKVILYSAGRVVQTGSPQELFGDRANPDLELYMALNTPLLLGFSGQ